MGTDKILHKDTWKTVYPFNEISCWNHMLESVCMGTVVNFKLILFA